MNIQKYLALRNTEKSRVFNIFNRVFNRPSMNKNFISSKIVYIIMTQIKMMTQENLNQKLTFSILTGYCTDSKI